MANEKGRFNSGEGPFWLGVRGNQLVARNNCKRFALPASAQPSLRAGSGTPKSSVGKVRATTRVVG